MPVTLKKISELAGVSIGTVDRALHGRSGVNSEVAKRVLDIAETLGYQPNIMAKALSIKRSPIKIGVIFHVNKNPFYESVVEGVNAAALTLKDFGISVIIKYGKDFDPEDQLRLIDSLIDDGVTALAIVPLNDDRITQKINDLQAKNIPVVLLVSELEHTNRLAYVGCDAFKVGRIAAGLIGIVNNGQGNVLYATSHLSMLGNLQRLNGFKDALATRYPHINLKYVYEFDNDEIPSYKKAASIFEDATDIDTIMIATGSLNGIFQAFSESPLAGNTKIIALDLAQKVLEGVKDSVVTASIVQHPYTQGYQAIKRLSDYFIYNTEPKQEECYINCDIKIYESLF